MIATSIQDFGCFMCHVTVAHGLHPAAHTLPSSPSTAAQCPDPGSPSSSAMAPAPDDAAVTPQPGLPEKSPAPPVPLSWEKPAEALAKIGNASIGGLVDQFVHETQQELQGAGAEVEAMAQKAEEIANNLKDSVKPTLQSDSDGKCPEALKAEVEKYKAAAEKFDFRGARGKQTMKLECVILVWVASNSKTKSASGVCQLQASAQEPLCWFPSFLFQGS